MDTSVVYYGRFWNKAQIAPSHKINPCFVLPSYCDRGTKKSIFLLQNTYFSERALTARSFIKELTWALA
jgi:hypothetical protein